LKKVSRPLAYPDRANRKAATQPLGHGNRIRPDSCVLKGIKLSRAPEAALHFIQHQQQVVLVAKAPQPKQEFRRIEQPAPAGRSMT